MIKIKMCFALITSHNKVQLKVSWGVVDFKSPTSRVSCDIQGESKKRVNSEILHILQQFFVI